MSFLRIGYNVGDMKPNDLRVIVFLICKYIHFLLVSSIEIKKTFIIQQTAMYDYTARDENHLYTCIMANHLLK